MTKRISIVFLASAALHAAVLGLVHFDSSTPTQAGSLLQVTIQASSPESNEEKPESNLKPVKPTAKENPVNKTIKTVSIPDKQVMPTPFKSETSRQLNETANQQEVAAVAVESITPEKIKTPSQSPGDLPGSQKSEAIQLRARTVSLLQADLEKAFALHFRYPRLAIKRGWQGEVQLFIHIEANGRLTGVSLLQSSGYDLLDQSAMKSLKNIEILPEAIVLLHGKSQDLILPVKYILL